MLRPTPYNLRPKSFTLVELLVALAMFSYLIMVISGVFISMQRAERRGSAENYLVTESRFMLEKIIREIRKGTIDYEEYYSRVGALPTTTYYGKNYGKYGQNFFDLGTPSDPGCNKKSDNSSVLCNNSDVSKASMDQNTGKNPSDSADSLDELANSAFFNGETSSACASKYAPSTVYDQKELYILTADGREKIMFRWDKTAKELQLLKLNGTDDITPNGIPDTWKCHPDWNSVNSTKCASSNIINADFLNITPNGIQITDVKFIISPLEDPYKAFYENSTCMNGTDPITIRHQPKITIVMTGEIDNSGVNSPFKGLMKGDTPNVTIQTTVSTMVYQDIPSYHPLTGGA